MPSATDASPREHPDAADPRRADIADAAARCFARWGVMRTRIADIAKEAGITRPAIYNHFADRDALVVEVMVRHIHARARELHQRVPCQGPASPLIVEALETGIVGGEDRAISALMLDDEVVHDTARLVAQSPRIFEAMSQYWRPYLEYAAERGELRPEVDLDQAVRWLTFIVFHFLTVPETVPPEEELQSYLRIFVVGALVTT